MLHWLELWPSTVCSMTVDFSSVTGRAGRLSPAMLKSDSVLSCPVLRSLSHCIDGLSVRCVVTGWQAALSRQIQCFKGFLSCQLLKTQLNLGSRCPHAGGLTL